MPIEVVLPKVDMDMESGVIAAWKVAEGDFVLFDSIKNARVVHRRLLPVATIKAGRIYGSASIPVVTL